MPVFLLTAFCATYFNSFFYSLYRKHVRVAKNVVLAFRTICIGYLLFTFICLLKTKIHIAIGTSAAALFPILILSFFNQPVGDDIWYTWMVKQHGFWETQRQWFITINGRYSANLFMSLNTWIHGSTISFKILPAVVIIAWLVVVFFVVKSVFDKSMGSRQCLLLSLLLVLVYYLNMPGLHEGCYWMSGVTGYQLPIILFVFYPVMIKGYEQQPRWKKYFLYPLYLFIAGGFHEMIAFMAAVTGLYCLAVDRVVWKKVSTENVVFMIAVSAAVLLQAYSIGNRYKADITAAGKQLALHQVFIRAVLQTGYHLTRRCLWSPSFWMGAIAVFLFANRYGKNIRTTNRSLKQTMQLLGILLPFLVFFPALLVVYIENNIAPLRVINVSYFVCTAGIYTVVALYAAFLSKHEGVAKVYSVIANKGVVFLLLPAIAAVILSSNERQVCMAIVSSNARLYDTEVKKRLQLIEACQSATCSFTCLQHQPPVLCPVDICQDPTLARHLEKVFRKKLVKQVSPMP